jgi:hypothetical protein
MTKNIRQILEGTGIGLLGGLLIGISDSDWIRLLIALVLIALTGKSLKDSILKAETSPGQSYAGIAAFFAVLVGLYINGQETFRQLPATVVEKWIEAGFSPEEARAMYLKQWEWENQKDTEPSVAVQAMIKSILDRMGVESKAAENKDVPVNETELQDSFPENSDEEQVNPEQPQEELTDEPAEG